MAPPRTHFPMLVLILLLPLSAAAAAASSFLPQDNYLINCGANSSLQHTDGRTFLPDTNAKASSFFLTPTSPHNAVALSSSSSTTTTTTTTTTTNPSLYTTATIFTQRTDYTFSVRRAGTHFLRLHFFPIANPLHNLRAATFSVTANGFTLLRDLSFSSVAHPSPRVMEYVLFLKPPTLALALTPSAASSSLAFLNAIELFSAPDHLFPPSVPPPVEIPTSDVALEIRYRVNMGGPPVSPGADPLWRAWSPDGRFLISPATARAVSVDPASVRYPSLTAEYAAPRPVYSTAQEMADANVGNQRFNVSWAFRVDPGFGYLVRLHFCDVVSKTAGSLLFDVYINNRSALASFDVSGRASGLSTACFLDFAVEVHTESILVQVGPPQMASSLPNAILNGLEIMKLSDSGGSLDGPRGERPVGVEVRRKGNLTVILVPSCVGGAVLLGLVVSALVAHFRHRKKTLDDNVGSTWLPSPMALHTNSGNSQTKMSLGSFASSGPSLSFGRLLAFSEIKDATKNFDESLVLGVGGFGKVYKGVLDGGLEVAVKRGNPRSQQGFVEFRTEIEMLSKLRHRHLVSLVGYCHEPNEMVLVYDFMAGGPLRKHLYGCQLPALSWKQRLDICIGAAKGLHYLHTGAAETIIHRDVKTTNILLDESLTAKVADFGLSKLGPAVDQTHVSTAVKGSFGYLDPEYFRRQQLTEKSDVYSFGVVLLEVLCARPAVNPSLPRDQVNIVEWAMNWQKKGQLERIIDPHLVGAVSLDSLRKFGETAEKCLADYGIDRPTMGDVLWNLEYALQLQESFARIIGDGSSTNDIHDIPEWISELQGVEHDGFSNVSCGTDATTSRVFSQLMDPKGR